MATLSQAEQLELELALLHAAIRCVWGGQAEADIKMLAEAARQVADHSHGLPSYPLAMAAAAFLGNPDRRLRMAELGDAVMRYSFLRFPTEIPTPEPEPEPDPPMPPPSWARDHDLMG